MFSSLAEFGHDAASLQDVLCRIGLENKESRMHSAHGGDLVLTRCVLSVVSLALQPGVQGLVAGDFEVNQSQASMRRRCLEHVPPLVRTEPMARCLRA